MNSINSTMGRTKRTAGREIGANINNKTRKAGISRTGGQVDGDAMANPGDIPKSGAKNCV